MAQIRSLEQTCQTGFHRGGITQKASREQIGKNDTNDRNQPGRVPSVLSSVLVLAFLGALHPVRLALTLLVISRARPVQNLLAFWVGCMTGFIPFVVVPLTLLHVTPMSRSLPQDWTPGSTSGHIQVGAGVFALSIAALVTVRSLTRRRQRAQLATREATRGRHRKGGTTSTLVLDSNRPTAISRLVSRAQEAPTEGGSAFRRLLRRVHNAWENGSLWVAYLIGFGFGGPQPDSALFVVAIIVGSGAAIGKQVIAVIGFVVGMLALQEIVLVSYLATPAKTQAVLRRLHFWALTYRRQILVAILVVVGVTMVARGMGSV
jgi:hypothetical protein